ncbi:MAG: hypothetical protein U5L72_18770 [Bacteroidales bacterium]|nr:hypothetical protein [Bacteroidales bacterium]
MPRRKNILNSEQGQDYLASAIFRAFRDYKQTIDSRSGMKPGNYVEVSAERPEAMPDAAGKTVAGSSGSQATEVTGYDSMPAGDGGNAVHVAAPVPPATGAPGNGRERETETPPASAADEIFFYGADICHAQGQGDVAEPVEGH